MRIRKPSTPLLVSIAIHAVVGALFVQALLMRHPLFDWFGSGTPVTTPPIERIGFLSLPTPKTPGPITPGRSGGDGRSRTAHPIVPLVAPPSVPTTIEPAKPGKPSDVAEEPSSGPLVGGGGPLRGVQPRYTGPRVWGSPGEIATAPKTPAERLDSVIAGDIAAHNDSLRVAAGNAGRAPGDWTFEKNGRKYGIDSKYIRLGPVSIPTAVLAMLPLNVTGNPTVYERERTLNSRHDEIFTQAQRGINDADFQKAVRSIRERKERERREADQIKQRAAEEAAQGSSSSPR
ncbi:MAG TPA: hypothetical protein VGT98_14250 [Candidatus Elarobacter sp.]|nr:hypothetical protein [Candidatus Elarobacter sp.]